MIFLNKHCCRCSPPAFVCSCLATGFITLENVSGFGCLHGASFPIGLVLGSWVGFDCHTPARCSVLAWELYGFQLDCVPGPPDVATFSFFVSGCTVGGCPVNSCISHVISVTDPGVTVTLVAFRCSPLYVEWLLVCPSTHSFAPNGRLKIIWTP